MQQFGAALDKPEPACSFDGVHGEDKEEIQIMISPS
jgi:hypothetical protein